MYEKDFLKTYLVNLQISLMSKMAFLMQDSSVERYPDRKVEYDFKNFSFVEEIRSLNDVRFNACLFIEQPKNNFSQIKQ